MNPNNWYVWRGLIMGTHVLWDSMKFADPPTQGKGIPKGSTVDHLLIVINA